jgi:prepilin-type N-terminal cleavage/methylation domain-containing protein
MRLEKGFTFIELLLVVALLSIITGVSTIFYSRFLTQNAVDNTVDQVLGSFRKAQMYSLSGRKDSNWGVSYTSNTITLYSGNSYATRNSALDENYTINNNITITGLTDINFSRPNGIPSTTASITVNGGNNSKTITINELGVGSR